LFTIPQVIELCKKYYKFGIAEAKFPLEKRTASSADIIEDLKALELKEIEVEIITYKDGDIRTQPGNKNIMFEHSELLDPLEYKLDSEGCLILKKLL
jgi:hypothetical protein